MAAFQKIYQADGSFLWWETAHGRQVDADYYLLRDWLAAGGIPDEVPYVAPPAAPDPLAVRASELLSEDGSNLRDDVTRFIGQVQALAADGVTLPEPLTFRELMTAIEAKWPADPGQAAAAGLRLRTAWDDIVYHCGSLRDADDLFPYLLAVRDQLIPALGLTPADAAQILRPGREIP